MNALSNTVLHQAARQWLADGTTALVVEVREVRGSTPRETDARMLVSLDEAQGTIGGGHLEWQAIAMARQALREHAQGLAASQAPGKALAAWTHTFALGPTLGQCCGGVVVLTFGPLDSTALARWPAVAPRFRLDLHGAGHVGQAIVKLLADIDCEVRWIDQRLDDSPQALPGDEATLGLPTGRDLAALPPHIHCLPTEDAAAEVAHAPPASLHLVLTHRHDLDLAIVDALLRREDVKQGRAWVGLIGSRTKRAAFEHRLQARGHAPELIARIACPIGLPGIVGKEPAVIAVSVVGQLLQLAPPSTDSIHNKMDNDTNSPA
jgi:xanthine dehydrogenase accessory factor